MRHFFPLQQFSLHMHSLLFKSFFSIWTSWADIIATRWEEQATRILWEEHQDKFNCREPNVGKYPGNVWAQTYDTNSPRRSEALSLSDSAKTPSTKIDGPLVNFRRRLSNRYGRRRRMLTMDIWRNAHRTVSMSTWFAQVGSSVRMELALIADSAEWFALPSPHILHVWSQICLVRNVGRNLQFLQVWVRLSEKSIVQRDGQAQERALAKLEQNRQWLERKNWPFSSGQGKHTLGGERTLWRPPYFD